MIGIFDSGIGGLTVVKSIMHALPGYDLLYFGDTARTPYGNKSRATVVQFALQDTAFLIESGARIIVMACNTASSVATEALAQKFQVPIFEVITPAVEAALQAETRGAIGVIGTRATIASDIYVRKIQERQPDRRVFSYPCPLLVPLVEEGWLNRPETRMIVKKYLYPLKVRQISTLILGCTHYPLLRDLIQRKIGRKVRVIDSSVAVADTVRTYLGAHPELDQKLTRNGRQRFFVSDVTPQFEKTARMTLKQRVGLEHVVI